jgi:hypothetical protein
MKTNQRVPAPVPAGGLLPWMPNNYAMAFADTGIGECRLRPHSLAFAYVVARIAKAHQ